MSRLLRTLGFVGTATTAIGLVVQLPVVCAIGLTASAMVMLVFPGTAVPVVPRDADREAPIDLADHGLIVEHFVRLQARAAAADPRANELESGLVSRNAAYRALLEDAAFVVSVCDDPTLIVGPTGAGKNELARRIDRAKRAAGRITGPFVPVNCALLLGDQHLTLLVGHVAGSYTGALGSDRGLLAMASGGLLFFDEVGELDLLQQAKLLHILGTKTYRPYGSKTEETTDAVFMFATNRDLRAMVAAGTFRADLLARIDTFVFRVPSLAERREDLDANTAFELEVATHALRHAITMDAGAERLWIRFAEDASTPWPDNFRGLTKAFTRMSVAALRWSDGVITEAIVETEIAELRQRWGVAAAPKPTVGGAGDGLEAVVAAEILVGVWSFDRAGLAKTVEVCGRHRTQVDACRELYGSDDATRLRRYLAKYGLNFDDLKRRS